MANKPPAFQFYVKDWLSSSTVRAMSLAARGAYIDLLAFAWQSQAFATLPNDPAQLRRLVGADSAEWADIWPQISGCFEVEDGHLVNRRLQDEARKREEFIKKQHANGAKGGRPSKNPGLSSGLPQSEARESSAVLSIQSSTDTGTGTGTGKQEDSTGGEQENNRKPILSTDTDTVLVGDWADQLKMDETEGRKFASVMQWKETRSNFWKGKPLFSLKAYRKVEEQYDKFYAKLPAGKKPHDLPAKAKATGAPGGSHSRNSAAAPDPKTNGGLHDPDYQWFLEVMNETPRLEHEKDCVAYPRRTDVVCNCGLHPAVWEGAQTGGDYELNYETGTYNLKLPKSKAFETED